MENWRRRGMGLDLLRSRTQPDLLRHVESERVESRTEAGRQSLDLGVVCPRSRYWPCKVGLFDGATRSVGLRRDQREYSSGPQARQPAAQSLDSSGRNGFM